VVESAAPEISAPPVQHSIAFTPPPAAPSAPVVQQTVVQDDPRAEEPMAPSADVAGNENQGTPGTPGFVPGPPRVGMRPAVIRPVPGGAAGRMSFSKGTTRHQFRPSGFRPPRAFTPPGGPEGTAAPESPMADHPNTFTPGPPLHEEVDERAEMPAMPPAQPPRNQPQQGRQPQQGNQNTRGGNRRNDGRPPQQGNRPPQQQGGQRPPQGQPPRHDARHPQPGNRGPNPQQRPPQPQQGFRGPPPPPLQPRPLPQQPQPRAEFAQEPVTEAPLAIAPTNDFVQLPAQPLAAGADALTPGTSALQPLTAADSAALAPFAEDIEIDESLNQLPVKRRELTGRDMLINVVEGEEIRIAVTRRGSLEELYMERSSTESHIGNIYKGRVTNVEPSIQAAFIDFGIGKNGFLHISDVHPQYFPKKMQPRMPQQRRQTPRPVVAPQVPVTPAADEGSLAQQAATDMPAVTTESTVTSEQGEQVQPTASVASQGTVTESSASENASGVVSQTEQMSSQASAEHDEGDENEETVTHPGEEPSDFGSAYSSEFDEDDEDLADYENGDLDDGHMKPMEKVGRKTPRHERPPIQQCLRRGQEVIVQVTKEGIGTKGPTLTSYISCPGRYLVMMPGMAQLGVSRKIEDLDQRRELKRTLQDLNPPKNLGFIIRTAGTDVSKKELQGDLNYLVRMWKVIANRIRTHKAPVELYQESDLVIRTIRDVFNEDIDRIIVDNEQVASRIRDFLSIVDPRSAGIVELYTGTMPLYQKFGVEREIEKINSRRVELNNGGSLVIDSTEALVAIDVNSGRYREMRDAELTAFNMNKEALKEVVRQLRLRDLGGVIVIDFIDMREERHKREIEHLLREELKNDRAKTKVLRMSLFCMIELTRQRVRPSLKRSIYQDCPHCHGSALIKTPESVSLDVMRRLAAGTTRLDVMRLDVRAYPTVATYLLNRKRKALVELEDKTNKRITIIPDEKLAGDQIVLDPYDVRGSLINVTL
jgi:ribonuclease E